jgi:hypothetical protein
MNRWPNWWKALRELPHYWIRVSTGEEWCVRCYPTHRRRGSL